MGALPNDCTSVACPANDVTTPKLCQDLINYCLNQAAPSQFQAGQSSLTGAIYTSGDPNDKGGPNGSGPQRWTATRQPLR